jgi:allantoate deiminase
VEKPVEIAALAGQVIARCRKLASYSEEAGSIRRTFLSPPMREVHREIRSWLEPLGARVRIDAAGNLRALYPANAEAEPRVLIGSHLDTVPNAGAFDGILGVVIAVALLEALQERGLSCAMEIAGFSEEEGVRFGAPFIGSRALAGRLDDALLATQDARGTSVREAIREFGLEPAEIAQAAIGKEISAYLEFHIEQGPVLDQLELPLAAVEAIAGQTRLEICFEGRANHAGTTPMDQRHDALAGAAEWILAVERAAAAVLGLVATVGSVHASPGAANVIAGEARLTLDARHCNDNTRSSAVNDMIRHAGEIARRRGLSIRWNSILEQKAVALDSFLCAQIEEALGKAGCRRYRMVSGAGHDAMILAEKVPAAMIFLRTPGGISHHPSESVKTEDVAYALQCGLHLLEQLASSAAFQKRNLRA